MVTILAIVFLPIQIGVAAGVCLSVLQEMWTTTQTRAIEFEHLPGTLYLVAAASPSRLGRKTIPGVMVLAFQGASYSFLNALWLSHSGLLKAIRRMRRKPWRLIVLEASSAWWESILPRAQILAE